MLNLRKSVILYPYLFALYPILFLYGHNIDQTPLKSILFPLFTCLTVTVLFIKFLNIFYNDPDKSGLSATIFLIFFFSYGHIHSLIIEWIDETFTHKAVFKTLDIVAKSEVFLHIPLLIVFVVAGILVIIFIKRPRFSAFQYRNVLNVIFLILILIPITQIGRYVIKAKDYNPLNEKEVVTKYHNISKQPDIYYIILDGYGRSDILSDFYNYDNHDFETYLKNKGFYIASNSHTNYTWTFLSLASSLNLSHITGLSKVVGNRSKDLSIPFKMIRDNRAINFLKDRGYQYIHFCSTWGATLSNPNADRQIIYKKGFFRDEFLRILASTTLLKLLDSLIIENLAELHLYTLQMLGTIPEIKEPTFTFAHIVMPHYPFIFDRYGNIKEQKTRLNQFEMSKWNDKNGYIEQLIFLNKKMKVVVDHLIEKSKVKPIIVIQGDHGPSVPGLNKINYLRARLSILNAYYLPDGGSDLLYPSVSPVNTFRIIFNYYFNSNYALLGDTTYFSSFQYPYFFKEVRFQ